MVVIRELDIGNKNYINSVSKLHMKAFPHFFLTQLGIPFLRTLYTGYLEDMKSGIIVAEDDNCICGFIAFSYDYPRFYKELLKHHLVRFALCSMGAAIRHPSFIIRLLGAFKKSDSVTKEEKYVELASICVDPSVENKGIGTQMIDYLKRKVDFRSYLFINLETDADDNDNVNEFYIKNGFTLSRTFVTAEGRRMNEYRYMGNAK